MRSLRVVRGLGTRPASSIAAAAPPLPLVALGITDISSEVTDELAICQGLPHLQRIEVVHSSWVRGLDDLVAFATAPVARRLRAVALTIGATTFELELGERGKRRLRLVVRPFGRKERVAQFTDVDENDRADLAGLATFPNLVGVEVVVAAAPPDGFDAWLAQLLDELPHPPRRITYLR